MTQEKIRTRFAPSPTGYLHIGGARTALFNWLFTRRSGGTFVLRIEDTDQTRSTEASTRAILDAMTWLDLAWDEGPFYQAERVERHRREVQRLIDEGKAYVCTCTPEELEEKRKRALAEGRKPKYDGTCRDKGLPRRPNAVVRFRCPEVGATVVHDLIKGDIVFNNEELDDLIIERADGYPTYNFAVVVDDADMKITHVIRGDDHVNNTPKQILIYEALGYEVPIFGHVPMILGADKSRLSKRHGATSVMSYQEMGFLPEALVNYLVRLGWSHGDQEIFTREELIQAFSLEAVGKSAAVFSPDKLLWLNQHYIAVCPSDRLVELITPVLGRQGVRRLGCRLRQAGGREPAHPLQDPGGDGRLRRLLLQGGGGLRPRGRGEVPHPRIRRPPGGGRREAAVGRRLHQGRPGGVPARLGRGAGHQAQVGRPSAPRGPDREDREPRD